MKKLGDRSIIPPVLNMRPRLVSRRPGTGGCSLWGIRLFILPHTLVGIALILAVIVMFAWALAGSEQQAKVTRCEHLTSSSKGRTHHDYKVHYIYAANGANQEGDDSVDVTEYRRITGGSTESAPPAEGATVRVRAIGVPPLVFAKALEPASSPWKSFGIILGFAAFWNAILSVFVYMVWIKPFRYRRLYRNGSPAVGEVLSKDVSKGKQTTYKVSYQFTGDDGQLHQGKMNVSKKDEFDQVEIGQAVVVLHPDGKRTPSVIYELGDYQCTG